METAREIFEKMDYVHSETNACIYYEKDDSDNIIFDKESRKVLVSLYKLTPDEVLATYKQCEELGWIK